MFQIPENVVPLVVLLVLVVLLLAAIEGQRCAEARRKHDTEMRAYSKIVREEELSGAREVGERFPIEEHFVEWEIQEARRDRYWFD